MGLKAPGNYLDQFWSDKILVLLCEGPKPQKSMISGFVEPLGTLIYGFRYTKRLINNIREIMETCSNILFL